LNTSILIERHRKAGAQLTASETPLLLSYGDVPAEYRAGCEGVALFDRTDRGSVDVVGPEAAVFLHRLLANSVRTLSVGEGNRNMLLSSRGKILAVFELELGADGVRLSTSPGQAAQLVGALDMYLFAEKLRLIDRSEQSAPLELCGPNARALAEQLLGAQLPEAAHAWSEYEFAGATLRASTMIVAGSPGVRLDGGPAIAEALWDALLQLGAMPAGLAAQDCLRAEAAWAEPGIDIDENVYPQEARMERAFSLNKGCYIGQEVVAKIDTYGGLNKRMVALSISHDDPLPRGTRLSRLDDGEWRDLGVITTWAYSFVLDTGLALAFVKRRHQAPGTQFRVGDSEATATIVVSPVRTSAVEVTGEFETATPA
jgi:folate-binding protein YgfZ